MWFHNWYIVASAKEIIVAFLALLIVSGAFSGLINIIIKR